MTDNSIAVRSATLPAFPKLEQWGGALDAQYFESDGSWEYSGISEYSRLAPRQDLERLRGEISRALAPAARRDVVEAAAKIVGPYRKADLESPKIYMAALLEYLAEYPLDVLEETAKEVHYTCRFFPAIAEVISIANRSMAKHRRRKRVIADMLAEHRRREDAAKTEAERKLAQDERNAELGRKLASVPGAPRLGEFLLAQQAMRFNRSGPLTKRWEGASAWEQALLRGEPWAITACHLGALAQQACVNPIGHKARIEILQVAMSDLDRARQLFEEAAAGGTITDEHFGRIRPSMHVEHAVSELLDRERIEGMQHPDEAAA